MSILYAIAGEYDGPGFEPGVVAVIFGWPGWLKINTRTHFIIKIIIFYIIKIIVLFLSNVMGLFDSNDISFYLETSISLFRN